MPSAPEDLPLARASTLVQQVHAELKARILDGRMAPGVELRDSVIARQMGVSRAPVRDACNLLVQSGLLSKRQNHPYRVREFSGRELDDLQLIRWGYESAAVRALVRSGAEVLDVDEPLECMTRAFEDGDAEASADADIAFHTAVVRSTGIPELVRRHRSLMEQMTVQMRRMPLSVIPTQRYRHEELLEVLTACQQSGDPDRILRLLSTHLLTTRADLDDTSS